MYVARLTCLKIFFNKNKKHYLTKESSRNIDDSDTPFIIFIDHLKIYSPEPNVTRRDENLITCILKRFSEIKSNSCHIILKNRDIIPPIINLSNPFKQYHK